MQTSILHSVIGMRGIYMLQNISMQTYDLAAQERGVFLCDILANYFDMSFLFTTFAPS